MIERAPFRCLIPGPFPSLHHTETPENSETECAQFFIELAHLTRSNGRAFCGTPAAFVGIVCERRHQNEWR